MSNLKEAVNKEGSSASEAKNISISFRYEECCKNHGADVGKSATDGCKEFMASDLGGLLCDACGCHRNFHKKRIVEDGTISNLEVRSYEDCCKNRSLYYATVAYTEERRSYWSTDGCLEFIASEDAGEGGSRAALTCAACGCHRNFHSRKVEKEGGARKASARSYGGSDRYDSDDNHYDEE